MQAHLLQLCLAGVGAAVRRQHSSALPGCQRARAVSHHAANSVPCPARARAAPLNNHVVRIPLLGSNLRGA